MHQTLWSRRRDWGSISWALKWNGSHPTLYNLTCWRYLYSLSCDRALKPGARHTGFLFVCLEWQIFSFCIKSNTCLNKKIWYKKDWHYTRYISENKLYPICVIFDMQSSKAFTLSPWLKLDDPCIMFEKNLVQMWASNIVFFAIDFFGSFHHHCIVLHYKILIYILCK